MGFCGLALEMRLSAVILAGGQSKRMGRDKAGIKLDGRTLLELAAEKLRAAGIGDVFLSGRPQQDYSAMRLPVLLDLDPGFGPLGGLERGLAHCRSPLLLVLAVDLPRMTAEFLGRMLKECGPSTGVVPALKGQFEPLAAIYPKSSHALLRGFLARRQLAACEFARECLALGLVREFEVPPADAPLFSNWNTPVDLPVTNCARDSEHGRSRRGKKGPV